MMGYQLLNTDRFANEGAVFKDCCTQQSWAAGYAAFVGGDRVDERTIGRGGRAPPTRAMRGDLMSKVFLLAVGVLFAPFASAACADPLPSWMPGDTKSAIIAFVETVSTPGSPDYVAPSERIATFDNDGNLWAEQPVYFQLFYALDKIKELASADPELAGKNSAVQAALDEDFDALLADHHEGLLEVVALSHAGMTTDEFKASVAAWLETARHPKTGQRYDHMIYQPMLELLAYLRERGFKTYIVSGGGIDFIRVFSEEAYNIPPEQVIGSSIRSEFKIQDDRAVTVKTPEVFFIDDKEGKPVAINHHIGRRPILASGNSDGDYQMLRYATSGDAPGFALILHHTDGAREWAYDRDTAIGRLDKALSESEARGWTVIDMERDWRTVFPFELQASGE